DQVPLRRRRRKVAYRDRQAELVGQPLQPGLPAPTAVAVATPAVRLDGQAAPPAAAPPSRLQRPLPHGRDRELRRLPPGADHHVALVAPDVVDAERDGPAGGEAGEVVVQDVQRLASPAPAGVPEVADPLLLLGIDADDRPTAPEEVPPAPGQDTELTIPVRVAGAGQALAVGPQRVALLVQQPRDGGAADREAAPGQLVGQLGRGLVRP